VSPADTPILVVHRSDGNPYAEARRPTSGDPVTAARAPNVFIQPNWASSTTAGEFSWHELYTTDYQAAFRFYAELFAWEQLGEFDMGAMGNTCSGDARASSSAA
jgi:hypothetical protein